MSKERYTLDHDTQTLSLHDAAIAFILALDNAGPGEVAATRGYMQGIGKDLSQRASQRTTAKALASLLGKIN